MSREAVARFLELTASDKSVEAAMNAVAAEDIPATAARLGLQRGLEFTAGEFVAAIETFRREHPGELDDAELAGVSGGLNPQPEPPMLVNPVPGFPWFSQGWAKIVIPRP